MKANQHRVSSITNVTKLTRVVVGKVTEINLRSGKPREVCNKLQGKDKSSGCCACKQDVRKLQQI